MGWIVRVYSFSIHTSPLIHFCLINGLFYFYTIFQNMKLYMSKSENDEMSKWVKVKMTKWVRKNEFIQ